MTPVLQPPVSDATLDAIVEPGDQLLISDAVVVRSLEDPDDDASAEYSATGPGAACQWCDETIPARRPNGRPVRRDSIFCSKRCRQASWRFGHDGPDHLAPGVLRPMTFAYADPPYPGMSWRHYRHHPDYAGEVDHRALISRLVADYPDGWALSTNSSSLRLVLSLVPDDVDVRIGAWTKPMPPQATRRARKAWEPVIFAGGRPRPDDAPLLLDWVHAAPTRTFPGQITGTKPPAFSRWVFDTLGAQPVDALDDLYPGSGAVTVAWRRYVDAALHSSPASP